MMLKVPELFGFLRSADSLEVLRNHTKWTRSTR